MIGETMIEAMIDTLFLALLLTGVSWTAYTLGRMNGISWANKKLDQECRSLEDDWPIDGGHIDADTPAGMAHLETDDLMPYHEDCRD